MLNLSLNLATILAFIISIVLFVYIYKLDKIEKEPKLLLFLLFVGGYICGMIISGLNLSYKLTAKEIFLIHDIFNLSGDTLSKIYPFVHYLCAVGVVEELLKFIVLIVLAWKMEAFNYMFDGCLYASSIGLGFAFHENIGYLSGLAGEELSFNLFLGRTVAALAHLMFGILMGIIFSRARRRN